MKTILVLAILLLPAAAPADKLEYEAHDRRAGAAQVRHARGSQAVKEGDEIPGWGRVKSFDDRELRLVRRLSDEERASLRQRGLLPVAAEEIIVPLRDAQTVPVTVD